MSPLTTYEGKPGRWFREFPDNVSKERMEQLNVASYGNTRSFWLTKEAIWHSLLVDAGFNWVYEVEQMHDAYQQRSFFVALK